MHLVFNRPDVLVSAPPPHSHSPALMTVLRDFFSAATYWGVRISKFSKAPPHRRWGQMLFKSRQTELWLLLHICCPVQRWRHWTVVWRIKSVKLCVLQLLWNPCYGCYGVGFNITDQRVCVNRAQALALCSWMLCLYQYKQCPARAASLNQVQRREIRDILKHVQRHSREMQLWDLAPVCIRFRDRGELASRKNGAKQVIWMFTWLSDVQQAFTPQRQAPKCCSTP